MKSTYRGVGVITLPSFGVRGLDAVAASLLGTVLSLGRYDVIHFHGLGPALFSCLPRLLSRSRIVVTCQGLDWQRAKWGGFSSRTIRLGERMAARSAHAIIVVSHALAEHFAAEHGRATVFIPNGPSSFPAAESVSSNIDAFGLAEGRYVIFLGRIVPEKRPDLALAAFRAVRPPGWKLAIVGASSDTDSYVASVRRAAGGGTDVVFTGERSGTELAQLLRQAGLMMLPSDVEGLPLAMLEAMAEGIPVVASDIPPHRQLLDNGRGTLFATGDLGSCEAALRWAVANPAEVSRMAREARDHVRSHYNWDMIADQTLAVYAGR